MSIFVACPYGANALAQTKYAFNLDLGPYKRHTRENLPRQTFTTCVTRQRRLFISKGNQCLRTDVAAISLSVDGDADKPTGPEYLAAEIVRIQEIRRLLAQIQNQDQKLEFLRSRHEVQSYQEIYSCAQELLQRIGSLAVSEQIVLYTLIMIGQEHVLGLLPDSNPDFALQELAQVLLRVESFYDSIGGLVGYHLKSLELICAGISDSECGENNGATEQVEFHIPPGPDLSGEEATLGQQMALQGLISAPELAEIYPLGGAGDRLGLKDPQTGEPLPAAMLQYCGRSMLEGMLRDLVAREYLYWCVFGRQITTPIAIMTSDAKGNHEKMSRLMLEKGWFGRGEESFRLFSQPLVPVVGVEDGKWLVTQPLEPVLKPGGHGAIWKLMYDSGVFEWLLQSNRKAGVVRQISNPLAATDLTVLALQGTGRSKDHLFGFASCPRVAGAAEGMNVLMERKITDELGKVRYEYGVSNVEYTEFERLGVQDEAVDGDSGLSKFPANTNVLYVDLRAAQKAVEEGMAIGGGAILPGMIFNMKKVMRYNDAYTGTEKEVLAGRMECTMQNIADNLMSSFDSPLTEQQRSELPTFVVYNRRRKVTSSAKRARKPGSTKIHQTPEGSFRDLMLNSHELLTTQCGISQIPEVGDVSTYLERGPGFIFLFNPALGPLWHVIGQKLQGGVIHPGAEVQLELAWLRWVNVDVKGSLIVRAQNVVGRTEDNSKSNGHGDGDRLTFSHECGRVRIENVKVENEGVDWSCQDNVYWKHQVRRLELCEIELIGNSEFEAFNVDLLGKQKFVVPDGVLMRVTRDTQSGGLKIEQFPLENDKPTWWYKYYINEDDGCVKLEFQESQITSLQQKQSTVA
eukprot:TRINITY_DN22728_c0_g2_i3.p1 TRINITY_DN22728_c0_g2~~TRINITY_DN22728_c0_g2_i3.p1  ORF type:complete len:857 (+),score=118.99 TRINITY_DN22728_c0_g2_i3:53-2623(+)